MLVSKPKKKTSTYLLTRLTTRGEEKGKKETLRWRGGREPREQKQKTKYYIYNKSTTDINLIDRSVGYTHSFIKLGVGGFFVVLRIPELLTYFRLWYHSISKCVDKGQESVMEWRTPKPLWVLGVRSISVKGVREKTPPRFRGHLMKIEFFSIRCLLFSCC